MRAYTIKELDALRNAVRNKELWGSYGGPDPVPVGQVANGCSRSFKPDELTRVVEEQVRTYMLAGHTAQDLLASEKRPATLSELGKPDDETLAKERE